MIGSTGAVGQSSSSVLPPRRKGNFYELSTVPF